MTINTKKKTTGAAWSAALVIGWLLASVLPVGAAPQIMTEYGDQMPWFSADINGMGSTGAALYRGGMSNVFNPAFLAGETGSRLDLGLALDQQHEDLFVPLFDGFESYVTDVAIASNRHHYFSTGFAFSHRVVEGDNPVSVAVSLADRYPYQYTFEEEVRNPDPYDMTTRDMILRQHERKVTGTLRDLSVGAGVDVTDRISFGAAVHYAFGTRTEVNKVRDYDEVENSYYDEDEFSMDGVNFTLGMGGVINERLEVGFAWESQLNATGDITTSRLDAMDQPIEPYDAEVRYPNVYRAGLTFRPRTDPRTVFTIEGEYKPWSELMDSETPRPDEVDQLEDTMDVRVGLEHTFYNGMPMRFGFRYVDSYADSDANASVFSAGIGAPFGNGMFSVSLELSKVSSLQEHQFAYPDDFLGDQYSVDPIATVKDTRFRVGAGYKVEF